MEKIFIALRYIRRLIFSGFNHLGWKVIFKSNVVINNPDYIYLGNNVFLDRYCTINAFTEYNNQKFNVKRPLIIIDDGVGISQGTYISSIRSIEIKKNSMIGPFCFIGDYDHGYSDINKPIVFQRLINIKPVVIEEGAWIGAHVTVSSGVTIGRNSVIGANSVVTKDIPAYSVAVGVPARVIKSYDRASKTWKSII